MSKKNRTLKSLKDLGEIKKDLPKPEFNSKEEYQEHWRQNKYEFREMVAKKNRRWLEENQDSDFKYYKEYSDIYEKISNLFSKEKSRKWVLHLITNFLPICNAKQVPKLPSNKHLCPITKFQLTDLNSILTGDRDKHIAFTGLKTDVVLSGIAVQELERFALNMTKNFDTPNGQIVNFALDKARSKKTNQK